MSGVDSSNQASSALLRYGLAVLSVGLAVVLTWLFGHAMDVTPALFFFVAVIVTTHYGKMGPALVAIALSTFAIHFFFIAPADVWMIGFADLPRLAVFIISAIFISSIIAARLRAEDALRQAHNKLESKVDDRTSDLAKANDALQAEIAERNLAERERERLLQDLKTERALLDAVLRQMPAGVVIAEAPSGKIILGNKQVEEILRHDFSLVAGVDQYETYACYSADGRAYKPEEMPLARSTLTGEVINGEEIHFVRGDETIGKVLLSSCPIRDREGKIVAGVAVFHDITEMKLAEEAILQSEERFSKAFNASPQPMTITTLKEGRYIDVNDALLRDVGYSREEIIGRTATELNVYIDAEDRARLLRTLEDRGEVRDVEIKFRTKSGEILFFSLSADIISLNGQKCLLTASHNITERKRAEEAMRLSEKKYRTLADAVPQLVWVNNAEGIKEYFNGQWQVYTGSVIEEPVEQNWLSLIHPDDLQTTIEIRRKGVQSGEAYKFEYRLRRADGTYRWHIARVVPMKDDNGRVLQWFGTATDIDYIKRAEESNRFLAEAGALLASSLDEEITVKSMAQIVVPYLADWCIVDLLDADGSVKRISGRHSDPSKEKWLAEILKHYSYNYQETGYMVAEVLRTGEPEIVNEIAEEWLAATVSDSEHLKTLRALGLGSYMVVPLVARGRTLGTISFSSAKANRYGESDLALAQDLAYRAALAIDNARLYREAHQANRVKDEFLATVSHELRTPLNAILGWAEILRSGKLDEPARARALNTILRNGKAQAQLIEDILDVSRIITGKLRLDARPVRLMPVISAAVDAVRPAAFAKDIDLQLMLDASASSVSGDQSRLQQVIWNLLSNAIKFTPQKGTVRVKLERDDSNARIIVSDTGAGITAEFLPYVFDRFRQADSSYTRRHGGLGLGLAIVRHLVEMHGGTVSAESGGEGKGATFVVRLPLSQSRTADFGLQNEAASNEKAAGQEPARATAPHLFPDRQSAILSGLWLLVVDDEQDAQELIAAVLERYGAKVTTVATAAAALDVLARCESGQRPDAILSDIGMPGEDGLTLIKRVRAMEHESGAKIPAIALTAYAREEDRARALRADYQAHIAKPFEPAHLVTTIAGLVQQTRKSTSN